MKAKRQQVSDLNVAIEELKRTVATKEEELSLTKQHLDQINRQTEELQANFMLMEQKYKDEQSMNLGNIYAKLWLKFQLFPSIWSSYVLSCPFYIYLLFPVYV